jgi:hypothetical protein
MEERSEEAISYFLYNPKPHTPSPPPPVWAANKEDSVFSRCLKYERGHHNSLNF